MSAIIPTADRENAGLCLNDLIRAVGIDPKDCTLMEHKNGDARVQSQFLRMAESDRDAMEFFQSTHNINETQALRNRPYTLSFIRLRDRKSDGAEHMIFIGLYKVPEPIERDNQSLMSDVRYKRIVEIFKVPYTLPGETSLCFDLVGRPELAELSGRLVVQSSGKRRLVLHIEKYCLPVIEVKRAKQFDPPIKNWRTYTLTASEVLVLGPTPRQQLSEWRGVYLIIDETNGARYVGAAYAKDLNILGRWQAHVAGAVGVTAQLRFRNAMNFRFSILERVSLDMPDKDLFALEQTWMTRLGTRQSYGWNGLNT